MESTDTNHICTYSIDKNDHIIEIGENWNSFAEENYGADKCHSNLIINKPIWDFVEGEETRFIYKIIFESVRKNFSPVTIPHRCDSPGMRRFMELDIIPQIKETILLRSKILRIEERECNKLLEPEIKKSDEFIRMCSMCKKVVLSSGEWVEVEEVVVSMKFFEKYNLPNITHGICPMCYELTMTELKKLLD